MTNGSIPELFDAIVKDRGGTAVLGIEQLAVARQLARALAADEGDPRLIIGLAELLPPRQEATYDLSRLTDAEFDTLGRLLMKAADKPWPIEAAS